MAESGADLLARKEFAKAIPLLKEDLDKYPSNPRIRLQYADALAGLGQNDEAIAQYEHTAKYYEDNGLTVQSIAVRKKADKLREANRPATGPMQPMFAQKVPPSPLFEVLNPEERAALVKEMELEQHGEGDVVITEGESGSSMYVIAQGEVKVYTLETGGKGGNVYLAKLGEGDREKDFHRDDRSRATSHGPSGLRPRCRAARRSDRRSAHARVRAASLSR